MSENFTLDEFAGEGRDEDAGIEPIEPVQRWTPEPATCPRCGTAVHERWADDAIAGVCRACKEW